MAKINSALLNLIDPWNVCVVFGGLQVNT